MEREKKKKNKLTKTYYLFNAHHKIFVKLYCNYLFNAHHKLRARLLMEQFLTKT